MSKKKFPEIRHKFWKGSLFMRGLILAAKHGVELYEWNILDDEYKSRIVAFLNKTRFAYKTGILSEFTRDDIAAFKFLAGHEFYQDVGKYPYEISGEDLCNLCDIMLSDMLHRRKDVKKSVLLWKDSEMTRAMLCAINCKPEDRECHPKDCDEGDHYIHDKKTLAKVKKKIIIAHKTGHLPQLTGKEANMISELTVDLYAPNHISYDDLVWFWQTIANDVLWPAEKRRKTRNKRKLSKEG